jgi:hypothetical protein
MRRADRDALVHAYELRLYPYGQRPQLDTDPEKLRHDTFTRKQWLILWLLGAFHTIGRTRDQQHRNFLELCEQHGWLDVFAAAQSVFPEERSDEYLTVLDEYFSDHGQWLPFYHWFRQYVTIYKSSRWLHEDVELVLEADKGTETISLDHTFTARLVAGFDAPPSAQALGIGRQFILRELVRFGVLHNTRIHEQCFVPVARVCRLMERIGCTGGIYASLRRYLGPERATFGGAFDLPLLFVAENEALQRQFLSGPMPPPPEGTVLIEEI